MSVMTTSVRDLTQTLRAIHDGEHAEIRDRVRWWLGMPGHEPVHDLPREEYRERVLGWTRELAGEGDPAMGFPGAYGGQGGGGRPVAGVEKPALGGVSRLG